MRLFVADLLLVGALFPQSDPEFLLAIIEVLPRNALGREGYIYVYEEKPLFGIIVNWDSCRT